MTVHILLGLAAVTLYAALLLAFPTGRCPRCLGKRVTRSGRRPRKCRACRGRGRVVWPGATAVHRFWWSVLGNHLMERRREQLHARQSSGEDR